MKVLVTGGTGFVGSHGVKALLTGGHEVRMLVWSAERIAGRSDRSVSRLRSTWLAM